MKKTVFLIFAVFLLTTGLQAQYQSYQVKEAESLERIAKKFGVSQEDILKLNPDLKPDKLAYKIIIIPARETDEKTPVASIVQFKEYRVKHQETLYRLALENNIKIEDIKKYNPYLYNEVLGENDMIRIPVYTEEIANFNAPVQTSTFENLLHIVVPKETKFGIGQQYGMTVEELEKLNPGIGVLQPGQVLKVKNPRAVNPESKRFTYYQVKPKETMYSLTKTLEISEDSLIKLNPIIKELGLQAGMELKIPRSIGSLLADIPTKTTKVDLREYLTDLSSKKVAVLLPFNLNKYDRDSILSEDILKKDMLGQIALDLYSGIKMAADSAAQLGIPINMKVLDTEGSNSKIQRILREENLSGYDIVIGPLLAGNIKQMAEQINNGHTLIFSPLVNDNLEGNDMIFQSRPSSAIQQQALISYLDSLKTAKNILVLGNDKNTAFVSQLTSRLSGARRIIQKNKAYLESEDLTKLLSEDKPNWVVLATEDTGLVSSAVNFLNAARTQYDIEVFSADKKGSVYDEIESGFLENIKFTYVSVNKNNTTKSSGPVHKRYKRTYRIEPNSIVLRGFDVAMDAFLRSAVEQSTLTSSDKTLTTEYIENRFNYIKKPINGYYNDAVYIIRHDENLQLIILN